MGVRTEASLPACLPVLQTQLFTPLGGAPVSAAQKPLSEMSQSESSSSSSRRTGIKDLHLLQINMGLPHAARLTQSPAPQPIQYPPLAHICTVSGPEHSAVIWECSLLWCCRKTTVRDYSSCESPAETGFTRVDRTRLATLGCLHTLV